MVVGDVAVVEVGVDGVVVGVEFVASSKFANRSFKRFSVSGCGGRCGDVDGDGHAFDGVVGSAVVVVVVVVEGSGIAGVVVVVTGRSGSIINLQRQRLDQLAFHKKKSRATTIKPKKSQPPQTATTAL